MEAEPIGLSDGQNCVELRVVERVSDLGPSEGDIRLDVNVSMDGFKGRYDQVWIARTGWNAFIESARRLERERAGRASLLSMSPGEFELHMEIRSRGGHVTASGCLARYHFGHPSGTAARSRVEYHCGVDPSMLRELVNAFAAMAAEST